jgi:transposase
VLADRGYFSGEEIRACEAIGVTPYVPKPFTSGAKADGRFGKQDFVYVPEQDVYRCPAGNLLPHHMTTVEKGLTLHRYWDRASCAGCSLKSRCTPSIERRVSRWEHEAVIDAMQRRMDLAPSSMRVRRRIVEHPYGTIKAWMGSTHFLMKRLKNVRTEIGLHVLAYNLKRVIAILGAGPLIAAIQA